MNLRFAAAVLLAGSAVPAYAGTVGYTQCGAHDGYILMYRSTEKFDEMAKLRCGAKLEVLESSADYLHVSTPEGKTGWVLASDISDAPSADAVGDQVTPSVSTPSNESLPALTMTNQSILDLHRAHASSDLIVSRIHLSSCSFNTSEYALHQLKTAGISDRVILEMLEKQQAPVASGDVHEVKVVVPGGTPVQVALSREVYANEIKQGAIVNMTVVKDVVVNGVTVIAEGASAHARVIAVKKPGGLNRVGEVAWFMQDAAAVTGDQVPVAFAPKQPDMIPTGRFEGYAYLLSEFGKNGTAIETHNRTFIAVVNSDTVMHLPHAVAVHQEASSAPKANAVNLLDR